MINKHYKDLSIRRQSCLLGLNRSSLYIKRRGVDNSSFLSNMITEIYSDYPVYGYRRITAMLRRQGIIVNRKKVRRLMQLMNLKAIYPGPNTSKRNLNELVHPYLLKDLKISRANQVWQVDITYLRTSNGFMYLSAIIDMHSRFVVGYRLSNSLCVTSCLLALEDAIARYGKPTIVNSDQGSQFTSADWVNKLASAEITISMTGQGRYNDNANIERLWRSFKYEGSYLYKWYLVSELKANIPQWLDWYNNHRTHQALDYKTPLEVYCGFMDKSYDLPTNPQYHQLLQESFL